MKNRLLRTFCFSAILLLVCLWVQLAYAQEKPPREFVSQTVPLSFVKSTPFPVVLKALNEFSTRLVNKVIVDPAGLTIPIGVDVDSLPWRAALELITAKNNITMVETDTYILLQSAAAGGAAGQVAVQPAAVPLKAALKPITRNLREINIAAVFFEADRSALREIGVNWKVFAEKGRTSGSAEQNTAGSRSDKDIGILELHHYTSTMDITALMKALETNDAGKVIANPMITVADGREGRVQIGQDFSIKQRDFAGNVTDQFVSAGIILTVTPTLYEEDTLRFIHLDVKVERSSATPGAISTIINKTQASTELLLNDGEKVGIGGLYVTEESSQRIGIPVLKNIPKWFCGLGYLFGYEQTSKAQKELIILLQAEVVPTLEERLAGVQRKLTGGKN